MVVDQACGSEWCLYHGDSAEVLRDLPDASVDLAIYSPPFSSLYTYSPSERDVGNARSDAEFFEHYGYIHRELLRVMKPGRNVCVHVQQLTTTKAAHGLIGMRDFRGDVIRSHVGQGWTFHGEITIDKDPQAQAIRTKSKALLFVQLHKDSSWLRPAMADYILIFRAPGENAVPIQPDISHEDWISWARPVWYGIRETHTLNVAVARQEQDERHICPLQLDTIERCVRLWSNPGEVVLSPFAGIGSELVKAIELGRKAIGVELKESYYRTAVENLKRAEEATRTPTLFELAGEGGPSPCR